VPDRLSDVPDAPLLSLVLQIRPLMEDFARRMEAGSDPAVAELADAIRALLDGQRLYQPLFAAGGSDSPSFATTKQALFEALYLLYLLRRVMPFDLADLQRGLRILHAWEAMAIDEC
jgi:hypothetical protein